MRPVRPPGLLVAAASALLVSLAISNAAAQTLTNPHAPKWSPPRSAAKLHGATQAKKSCKQFGAGFVAVSGTDACVKIGGWVTVEGGASGR
jgi:porin-like protein